MDEAFELGYGVRVRRLPDGRWLVSSSRGPLPLDAPAGEVPGTAVSWRGELWEVGRSSTGGGRGVWELQPWREGVAVRRLERLDADAVDAWFRPAAKEAADRTRRLVTAPLLPLLGLAPSEVQESWRAEWGFRASAATVSSALLESLVGAFGTIFAILSLFAGRSLLAPWLAWLMVVGPVMLLEGLTRLASWASSSDPVGSVFGFPFAISAFRRSVLPAPVATPEAVEIDDEHLRLRSPVHRVDWVPDAELRYRDRRWRLAGVGREGLSWIYDFEAVADDVPAAEEQLLLASRPRRSAEADRPRPELGVVAVAVLTVVACFSSPDFQRRWAQRIAVRPRTLTVIGAAFELLGGFVNLQRPEVAAMPLLALLNAALIGEGAVRLVATAVLGRPIASLLGAPLEPLARRWLDRRSPPAC